MSDFSKFFNLNLQDFIRGFVVAVLTAFATVLYQTLESGAFPSPAQLKVAGINAAAAGVGYLLKNFLTNSENKMLTKESKEPVVSE